MNVSARAALAAGVTALTGGALMFTPSVLPATMSTVEVVRPVAFAADGTPITPVSDDDVRAALELIGNLGSVAGPRKVTVRLGGHDHPEAARAILPTARVVDAGGTDPASVDAPAAAADGQALDEPVAQNAASDLIDTVYSISRYWANYVSLELGPWLINWIPFGYLISDQIYIWYPDFVLPVVDSFVYDFLDPVVNDPLNLNVWLDGIGDIINTALTGVYNGVVGEIQYALSFDWFPIPLPPLPPFPPLPIFDAADSAPTEVTLASSETDGDETGATAIEATDSDDTDAVTDVPVDDPITETVVTPAPEDAAGEEAPAGTAAEDEPETPVEDVEESVEDAVEEDADEASGETGAETPAPAEDTGADGPGTDEPASEPASDEKDSVAASASGD
ncbi:hypothetical protein [Mycolicibacterium vanbaalenii]|uniref:Uncharacterized protein n=1 Tax=Mycolicibacterium vanbaalenii (strain DSM 7251 / JCM 13017 / BCRC 16820 / KCTC 9966 / NRRL B-24157 / PYR-1) TaxID=350058 RepID=A1TBM5_MYCVP|nr:hypothetical protein [Mycolicibacterium vanbaalenii]ABM14575.1 conserved hypothetical protein [Mycolicibacterium vanbaalenii PYR-1]MCV7127742.1 hypothetical protein [Mycolicibacterium vanbaalenii PYR-1]